MRKIVAGLFISLDGVTESPEKWNGPFFNDEMGQAVGETIATKDTLLLGRRTFEEFAAYWPDKTSDDDPFADFINNTPKVVVSSTLGEVEWQPTAVIRSIAEVRKLKERPGQDIGITGSVTLAPEPVEGRLDRRARPDGPPAGPRSRKAPVRRRSRSAPVDAGELADIQDGRCQSDLRPSRGFEQKRP